MLIVPYLIPIEEVSNDVAHNEECARVRYKNVKTDCTREWYEACGPSCL